MGQSDLGRIPTRTSYCNCYKNENLCLCEFYLNWRTVDKYFNKYKFAEGQGYPEILKCTVLWQMVKPCHLHNMITNQRDTPNPTYVVVHSVYVWKWVCWGWGGGSGAECVWTVSGPVLNEHWLLIVLFPHQEPNPEDPLNKEAAEVLQNNRRLFEQNVQRSMRGGYIGSTYFERCLK